MTIMGLRPWLLCTALVFSLTCSASAASMDELLKRLPGQNYAATAEVCDAIVAEGADGIAALCARLIPLGQGDDSAVRYALSGLAKHVTRAGAEGDRQVLIAGLAAGLAAQSHGECKVFIVEQLQFAGDDTAVPALANELHDTAVSDAAIMALMAIGTAKAADALEASLDRADGSVMEHLRIALNTFPPVELTPDVEEIVVPKAGGIALPAQLIEAQELAAAGKERKAARLCRQLLDTHVPPVVCAQILDLLVGIEGQRAVGTLMDLMDHHSADCRAAALGHAAKHLDKGSIRKWQRVQAKAEPVVQAEIAAMLAESQP